jgi:arylsulfatase A-like enzyme
LRYFLAASVLIVFCASFIVVPKSKKAPNIIFIQVDDLTYKYLGCFGDKNAKTPNIDRLATQGVVFENAVCQGVMCGPSRNSIITGLYPHNLGFYENGQLPSLPKNVPTFTKELQTKGYTTMWVGKSHLRPNTDDYKGLDPSDKKTQAMKTEMGFDYVYQSAGRTVVSKQAKDYLSKGKAWKTGKDNYADFLHQKGLLEKFVAEVKSDKPSTLDPNTEYMDGHFTTHAIDLMKSYVENKPFFMWVNFSCPHEPFDVPQKYIDDFSSQPKYSLISRQREKYDVPSILKPHIDTKTPSQQAQYLTEYAATIHYMDEQVGRIVDFIRASQFSENTMIVFFSDHGIMAGDHGLLHKGTLYKEVLNPSLIISYPKHFKAKRESTTVELIDVPKTIMQFAGVKNEVTKKFNGNDLTPLLTGKGRYKGSGLGFSEIEDCISVTDGRYKCIQTPDMDILFDLKVNPNETENIATINQQKVAQMKGAIAAFINKTGKINPPAKEAKNTED